MEITAKLKQKKMGITKRPKQTIYFMAIRSLIMSLSGLCLSGVFDKILGMCPIKKQKPKSGNDDFLICMATSLYCPFEKE